MSATVGRVLGTLDFEYQGTAVSLRSPWRRATMIELTSVAASEDVSFMRTIEEVAKADADGNTRMPFRLISLMTNNTSNGVTCPDPLTSKALTEFVMSAAKS